MAAFRPEGENGVHVGLLGHKASSDDAIEGMQVYRIAAGLLLCAAHDACYIWVDISHDLGGRLWLVRVCDQNHLIYARRFTKRSQSSRQPTDLFKILLLVWEVRDNDHNLESGVRMNECLAKEGSVIGCAFDLPCRVDPFHAPTEGLQSCTIHLFHLPSRLAVQEHRAVERHGSKAVLTSTSMMETSPCFVNAVVCELFVC
mmetsp:Transcript_121455/g.288624  ORF Transcript_121455/g.288624 Transcript_121455/m.288624 type:complete len:201 (+) Transcript_121455:183-785(+)